MQPENNDNDFLPASIKEKDHPPISYLSLTLLWTGIAFCISAGLTSSPKVLAAIGFLLISTALTYFKSNLGIKVAFGTILLGVVGLLTFTPVNYSVGIGVGNFKPAIEVLPLLVGIVHYFTNRKTLSQFSKDLLNRNVSDEEAQSIERSKINNFKKRYARKSVNELRTMTNNKGLLPEARKAATEILKERT